MYNGDTAGWVNDFSVHVPNAMFRQTGSMFAPES